MFDWVPSLFENEQFRRKRCIEFNFIEVLFAKMWNGQVMKVASCFYIEGVTPAEPRDLSLIRFLKCTAKSKKKIHPNVYAFVSKTFVWRSMYCCTLPVRMCECNGCLRYSVVRWVGCYCCFNASQLRKVVCTRASERASALRLVWSPMYTTHTYKLLRCDG